jgi:hypothetical protein
MKTNILRNIFVVETGRAPSLRGWIRFLLGRLRRVAFLLGFALLLGACSVGEDVPGRSNDSAAIDSVLSLPAKDSVAPVNLRQEIYVSTVGDDSNDGRSPDRSLKTLSKAATLIKNTGRQTTLVLMDDFPDNSLAIQAGSPPLILTNHDRPVKLRRLIIGENNRLDLRGEVSIDGNGTTHGVMVFKGSVFNMHSGTITQGKGSGDPGLAGGVSVYAGGAFNLYGGTITGNTSGSNRMGDYPGVAGVYVGAGAPSGSAGVFNMWGGTISDNNGGCSVLVRYSGSVFNLYGGTISNSKNGNGCGVQVRDGGTFNMEDGTISGHTGHHGHAGGVTVSAGSTFSMSGGKITGNEASSDDGSAGGVYLQGEDAVFHMLGGEISKNMGSHNRAGGVYVSSGSLFNREGGKLGGNFRNIYRPQESDVEIASTQHNK